HLPACADDSYGDLAPVRDQDFLQREVSTGPPMIPVFRDLMTLRARPEISVLLCSGRRGAHPARREERAYRVYESDEQRSPAGCIGGQSGAVISGRALTLPSRRNPRNARNHETRRPCTKRFSWFRVLAAAGPAMFTGSGSETDSGAPLS